MTHEVGDELRELVGLLHFDEMPSALDDLETRPRERFGEALAALEGDNAIVAAPDDHGGCGDTTEKVR